jgi:hypothetical protein
VKGTEASSKSDGHRGREGDGHRGQAQRATGTEAERVKGTEAKAQRATGTEAGGEGEAKALERGTWRGGERVRNTTTSRKHANKQTNKQTNDQANKQSQKQTLMTAELFLLSGRESDSLRRRGRGAGLAFHRPCSKSLSESTMMGG